MNAKARRNKQQKALEAKIVKENTTVEEVKSLNNVFIYDDLNVHAVQADVWDEEKNGVPYMVGNYEILIRNKAYIAHKRLGESISGKLYQLTDEQLEATEKYYGGMSKRVVNENIVLFGEAKE